MSLHNKINSRLLRDKMHADPVKRVTVSFYRYFPISNTSDFRNDLYEQLARLGVLGRIYLATEGINAQVSVPEEHQQNFKNYLYSLPFLNGVRLNVAVEDNGKSFFKLKILVRNKIVADGLNDSTFDVTKSGTHVDALEFNNLAKNPDTVIVDMRNHYESEVGHFKNAILPDVDTFREELQVVEKLMREHKDKNLLMYCTGGIRCEKASAWMKHLGYTHVFQLNGGIIKYAQDVKSLGIENRFIGKNFVFDERLGERITDDVVAFCHQCGTPCDDHTNCKNDGCHLLFLQCEKCGEKFNGCCSADCQEILALPAEEQKERRKGVNLGRQVFKKGRSEKIPYMKKPAKKG